MVEESIYRTNQELQEAQLTAIVDVAAEIYQINDHKPIQIIDLATGPNNFNQVIVRSLVNRGIDYELTLSDISPKHFKIGYENLKRELTPEELQKVKCVLADSRDFRRDLTTIQLWGEDTIPLEEVLADLNYEFLQTGYQNGQRTVDFSDGSFDLVIGCIPYGSISTGFPNAIRESARVLRDGGYHIVDEMQVEEIHSYGLRVFWTLKEIIGKSPIEAYFICRRSLSAMSRAKTNNVEEVKSQLDKVLMPVAFFSTTYKYETDERIPEQTLQYGDSVKRSVIIHQKSVS